MDQLLNGLFASGITFDAILPFLIVCPLVGLAGFVDAIAGGGGLISLPAYLIAGLPVHSCLGTNKLSSCMGTAVATWRYHKAGFIKLSRAVPCAAIALLGSCTGANLALLIPDGVFRMVMVVIIPLTAVYLMRTHSLNAALESPTDRKTLILCMLISVAIGVYDGLYGPGTGTFLMLAFTGVAHLTLNDAAGTTKVVNLTTNLAALFVFLANGQVMLLLGLVAGACNMIGAWLGARAFTSKGANIAKPVMLVVLTIFMAKTIFELVAG
ncbi:MAG: TSUP family transporter [Coriobacteriia bacterium]|nr:TSUP family transporter [Coriobacteriia bacterium]